jgi:hypothetical protein
VSAAPEMNGLDIRQKHLIEPPFGADIDVMAATLVVAEALAQFLGIKIPSTIDNA